MNHWKGECVVKEENFDWGKNGFTLQKQKVSEVADGQDAGTPEVQQSGSVDQVQHNYEDAPDDFWAPSQARP